MRLYRFTRIIPALLLGAIGAIGAIGAPITPALSAPLVTSVAPAPQVINAQPSADIVVDFASALDPASVTDMTFRVWGRWSGPASGALALENSDTRIRFTPAEPFFAGEYVTVMLSRGVTAAGGDSLTTGYAWSYWIRTVPASLDLTLISQFGVRLPGEGHIQTYGAYAGDLNDDGFSDLAFPNEISVDVRVFHNNGVGGYNRVVLIPLTNGSSPSANEGADFDHDGDIDLAVCNGGNSTMNVLMGTGFGTFETSPAAYTSGASVRGVAILDLNADGHDDIVTANRSGSDLRLFYNDGSGIFDSSVSQDVGTAGETSIASADFNNDGILDVAVGALFSGELSILLCDGAGNLTVSDQANTLGAPWMLAVGDVNGDGNVDIASANSTANNLTLAFCDGAGGIDSIKNYPTGGFALAIDLGDIDGDGDLDVVTSNFQGVDYTMYENDGTGVLINRRNYPASSAGSCAILHDRDNDGDMDMTTIDELDDLVFIFNNGCCQLAGDATGDGQVNIGDATFLIAWIFSGGSAPGCMDEGDANGDNSINIADVTALIAWMFAGGAAPVCGTTGS